MYTRREVLYGGLLTLLYSAAPCAHCQTANSNPTRRSCLLTPDEAESVFERSTETRLYVSGDEPMIPKSGNKNFDLALAQTLSKCATLFGVLPGFAYYDDYDGKNAYATTKIRTQRSDGTVLFGTNLLSELMAKPESPTVAVTAVCAHEFGHILQYKHGLMDTVLQGQRTVKRAELQADFFAGYFAGKRKRDKPNYPAAVVAATQSGYGDENFDDESHHGTNQERGEAVSQGFKSAYVDGDSLPEAIQKSINYVSTK